ncbi:MAG: cadherin-like domain-containing protein, partial [Dongiaceae bacterium]
MISAQQNAPEANSADGQSTSLLSATVAQSAVLNANDLVLVAAVAPEQQNEFVGMSAEQLMQLDLYFVPGGETPATPQSGGPAGSEPGGADSVCPEGQHDSSTFASLEPAAEEAAAIVAATDPNAAPVEDIEQLQVQENPDLSAACIDDLTELSLLELMSVRVAAEPTPILPQLQPVDLDTLFDRSDETDNSNRKNLNEDSSEDTFFPPVPDPVQPLPPFNVSPIAGNDKFAIAEDGTLTVTGSGVLKNDSDGNGDTLSVSLIGGPSNGTLTLNANGRFTYTPNADYNGTDSFTYQVADGNGGFDSATVTLIVTAVNDAPVLAAPGTIAVTEDTAAAISGISVADVDVGTGMVTVTLAVPSGGLSAASSGGVTVGGTASALTLTGTLADINTFLGGSNVTYTPALNNDSDVNLTVTVNDKGNTGTGGAKSDSEVITLDVQPVNDA